METLKEHCHEFLCFQFFHQTASTHPPDDEFSLLEVTPKSRISA
jgi:hypothetical protein